LILCFLSLQNDPEWVVATLDVNISSRLLCEELVGDLPFDHQFGERAYLSNVCVLPSARRLGFAEGILKAACGWSKGQNVKVRMSKMLTV